ncbi:hypothetical protein [Streptomyces sp. 8L]|uniref:hypothetical protein n=1 Tax=Streptomyces sp. 8L TaxID=2877242 RepID=UPI001CD490E5|nr:hypothetical protein [Streptomyces sp. 8L]MCA1222447.1 hypothetical protein [Streptomyces sp. 8L]
MTDPTVPHAYLSTGCLHGHHDYCQSHTGLSGAKKPSQCKFCGAACTCPCHTDTPEQPTGDLPTVIHRTPEQLRAQRARLIASTGLTESVLCERGETFQLYPEHQAVWETVKGIDYLLTDETGR